MAYTKYSLTPANNNAAPPDGAPEGMLPSAVNDTMRDMMAQIRDCGDGIRGGTYTMTAPVITGGSISGSTMSSNVITGGSINNAPIGASTANTGAFTTLAYTGTLTGGTGVVNIGNGQVYKDADGNVGFGTTSPNATLNIVTSDETQPVFETEGSEVRIKYDAGAVPASYDAGEMLSLLNLGSAYAGSGDKRIISFGASPATATNGTGTEANSGYVRSIGNLSLVTGSTERMRIGTNGNISLGPVYASAGSQNTVEVFASDNYIIYSNANTTGNLPRQYFVNPNGVVGSISVSGSATTYATSSDYRLKENIAPMTGALDTVAQLKPCTYTWKVDGDAGQGFIAHELQAVVPDAVSGSKDGTEDIGNTVDADGNIVSNNVTKPTNLQEGWSWKKTGTKPVYQGIDTSFLVATLTAAIQELKAEVDSLKAQINAA